MGGRAREKVCPAALAAAAASERVGRMPSISYNMSMRYGASVWANQRMCVGGSGAGLPARVCACVQKVSRTTPLVWPKPFEWDQVNWHVLTVSRARYCGALRDGDWRWWRPLRCKNEIKQTTGGGGGDW